MVITAVFRPRIADRPESARPVITWKPRRVPEFLPFAALRYATDDLESVIAPPYDVLSDAQVDELTSRSVHNIVRVDVPRGGPDRYDHAADTLRDWVTRRRAGRR